MVDLHKLILESCVRNLASQPSKVILLVTLCLSRTIHRLNWGTQIRRRPKQIVPIGAETNPCGNPTFVPAIVDITLVHEYVFVSEKLRRKPKLAVVQTLCHLKP